MKLKAGKAVLAGALAAALAGCSDGGITDDFGPPPGFSFIGTWQLSVEAALDCWGAFETRIAITQATVTTNSNGTLSLNNPAGWWYMAGSGPDNPSTLSGSLNPTSGTFSLLLWRGADATKQGHFDGVATSETHISGTFTDPDDAFRGAPGTKPCSANAHAIKD
jgi:hypothetical protein